MYHYMCAIFSNFVWASPNQVQILRTLIILKHMNMSKIGHLQQVLKDIFDQFTLHFVNKMHWLQLQYRVEKNRWILVFVHIFRKNVVKAVMKSAMYVLNIWDLDFLRAYLSGLVLTLAVWYVQKYLWYCIGRSRHEPMHFVMDWFTWDLWGLIIFYCAFLLFWCLLFVLLCNFTCTVFSDPDCGEFSTPWGWQDLGEADMKIFMAQVIGIRLVHKGCLEK